MLTIRRYIWKWRYSFRCHGWLFKKVKIHNLFVVNRMKEQVHEIDLGAYIIMSEVADIFSNNIDKV